jgi:hypothetical protein
MDDKRLGDLRAEVEADLAKANEHLSALQLKIDAIERRKDHLEGILTGLNGLAETTPQGDMLPGFEAPPIPSATNSDKNGGNSYSPNGRGGDLAKGSWGDKLVTLLQVDGKAHTLVELLAEMKGRGWVDPGIRNPLETLRHAANALAARDSHIKRIGAARYRYVSLGGRS